MPRGLISPPRVDGWSACVTPVAGYKSRLSLCTYVASFFPSTIVSLLLLWLLPSRNPSSLSSFSHLPLLSLSSSSSSSPPHLVPHTHEHSQMGKFYESIIDDHAAWMRKQHLFFCATAPISAQGTVNTSPKGYDSFRIINPNQVCYLDLTGNPPAPCTVHHEGVC